LYLKYTRIRYIVLYSIEDKFYLRGVCVSTKEMKIELPMKQNNDSILEYSTMYDKMPYVKDPDLNIERIFTKVTGNIIKSYRCQIKEPYEIKHD
jgi:hypothetical protein